MKNKEFIDMALDTKFFRLQVKEKSLYLQITSLICLMLTLFSSCSLLSGFLGSVQEPKFSVKKVEITKITLQNVSLKILTGVKNPYPISLPKSNLNMDVLIEGTKFANFSNIDLGKVEGNAERELPIDVLIKYSDILDIYKKIPGKEVLSVSLSGVLSIPIPEAYRIAGKKSFEFPFSEEKKIPALLPQITIKNFKILKPEQSTLASKAETAATTMAMSYLDSLLGGKKTSLRSAAESGLGTVDINVDTEFDIELANKAAATLNFSNLNYELMLGGETFLNGKPKNIVNRGRESILTIKTSFPLKSLSQGIATAIQKKTAPFRLKGVSDLKVPGLPDGALLFEYDDTGTLSW